MFLRTPQNQGTLINIFSTPHDRKTPHEKNFQGRDFSPRNNDIISWQFSVFQYKFNSQQVKQHLTSSIVNSAYELPHTFSNELKQRMLGN